MRTVIMATIAVVGLALAAPAMAGGNVTNNGDKGKDTFNTATAKGGKAKAGAEAGVFGSGNSTNTLSGTQSLTGTQTLSNSSSTSTSTSTSTDQSQGQIGINKQAQGQVGIVKDGDQSVVVEGDTTEVHAEPAIAPGLAALTGTSCMGSTTASGAGMGLISLGFGTTWTDSECNLRENIKLVSQMDEKLARAMIIDLSGVKEAMARMAAATAAKNAPKTEAKAVAPVVYTKAQWEEVDDSSF